MTRSITLNLHRSLRTAVNPTPRVCQVAAMFGLGVDQAHTIDIVPPLALELAPGQVVFITGASGGGKTTLVRLIESALGDRPEVHVIDFAALRNDDDGSLVDALGGDLEDAVRWLALAGLNDAFVMLRRPDELSDGQRYRFRLARAMAMAESLCCAGAGRCNVVLADEFASTLDRLTAQVIARNIRKWTRRAADVCFVAATSHDDLLEPLDPDVLVVQHPGGDAEIATRGQTACPPRRRRCGSTRRGLKTC